MQRMMLVFGASLAGLALLGWLSTQAWFYTGLGVQPNLAAPNDALALLLFMLALPPFLALGGGWSFSSMSPAVQITLSGMLPMSSSR